MISSQKAGLVIDALLIAIWRRIPKDKVLIHSDHGFQYSRSDCLCFVKDSNMELYMSCRGNCHDNVVAESF